MDRVMKVEPKETKNVKKSAVIDKNDESEENVSPPAKSGRMYIPHGYGEEKPFKPHISHHNVSYTECGPDWKSKLRWLPSPKPGEGRPVENTFYPPMTSIRHFPDQSNAKCESEYKFYRPHGTFLPRGSGKRTLFDQIHKASLISNTEITDSMRFGNRGNTACPRNGISEASPGDKSYQAAEYSPSFHQTGSTRPVVNFGQKRVTTRLRPTIILSEVVPTRCKPYVIKEAERRRTSEIDVVKSLNSWRPASPLIAPILEAKSTA